jgi:hypothetical protein
MHMGHTIVQTFLLFNFLIRFTSEFERISSVLVLHRKLRTCDISALRLIQLFAQFLSQISDLVKLTLKVASA